MKYAFTYLDCQKCKERIRCDDCEKRLTEALLRIRGIRSADIQMAAKSLCVDTDLDADTLEEALEDLGIFVR
ncbi:MAG: heavy-metal-associated domain-containing protein [Faecousia sp.]